MNVAKIAPWAAAGLVAVSIGVALRVPRPVKGHDVIAFGRLPVLEGGRVKPIDSVARNSLLMIRSQQSFRFDDRTISADELSEGRTSTKRKSCVLKTGSFIDHSIRRA